MNNFRYIKSIVTPKMIALKYIGYPKKNNGNTWFYYSPLRTKERTPSLAVNDKKGITDFGTGKNYDIFSFVSNLFNCNLYKACDIIAFDFNISIDKKISKNSIKIYKNQIEEKKIIEDKINNWYENTYTYLTNIYKEFRKIKFEYSNDFNNVLPFVYKKELYYESLVDLFYNADAKTKLELYKNRERFEFYER